MLAAAIQVMILLLAEMLLRYFERAKSGEETTCAKTRDDRKDIIHLTYLLRKSKGE